MLERRIINNEEVDVLTVEDRGFGGVYTLRSSLFGNDFPTYLYSSPPESPKELNNLFNKLTPLGKNSTEAILSYDNNSKMVGVYGKLKPGDTFLARELPEHPEIMEVVTFSPKDNKDPDMPETGDAIEIKQKGYVLKSQVQPAQNEKLTFKAFKGPVFRNRDLAADVKQNNFGDCFLLASALAISHRTHGKRFIKSMMIADGKDYTIVRLFHPETLEPCYIRVRNSYIRHNGEDKVLHKAPWVHILEKAYTAFAFKNVGESFKLTFPATREMFGNGGDPSLAMTILTGERAEDNKINQAQPFPLNTEHFMLCLSAYYAEQRLRGTLTDEAVNSVNDYLVKDNLDVISKVVAFLKQDKDINDIIADIKNVEDDLSIVPLLEGIAAHVDVDKQRDYLFEIHGYMNKYTDLKLQGDSAIEKSLPNMRDFAGLGEFLFKQMQSRQVGLDELFVYDKKVSNVKELIEYFNFLKLNSFPTDYAQCLREFAFATENIPDAPIEVAYYSEQSLAIYKDIEAKLKNKKENFAITATTLPKFDEKVAGLRNRHVYSVVRVEKDKEGRLFVVVRNPWGHTGREYNLDEIPNADDNNRVVENRENAESPVLLSDFVKYFRGYSVGQFSEDKIQRLYSYPVPQPQIEESFIERHGWKILIGALVVTALVIGGIFTFGAIPAIAAGITAGFALVGATVSLTLATAIGVTAIGLAAAAVGAFCGAIIGKIVDVCKRRPRNEYQAVPTNESVGLDAVPSAAEAGRGDTKNMMSVLLYHDSSSSSPEQERKENKDVSDKGKEEAFVAAPAAALDADSDAAPEEDEKDVASPREVLAHDDGVPAGGMEEEIRSGSSLSM